MTLVDAEDADFAWMLGEATGPRNGLRLPPGGVDQPAVLNYLRRTAASLRTGHGVGSWLVAVADEIVGLCGYKHCPTPVGAVEIGYGIIAARRGQGLATQAVAALLKQAAEDGAIRRLTAETAVDNIASQRVLEKNGFARAGTRDDPDDGALILWGRVVC